MPESSQNKVDVLFVTDTWSWSLLIKDRYLPAFKTHTLVQRHLQGPRWLQGRQLGGINLDDGLQISEIPNLTNITRILAIHCMLESDPEFMEGDWSTTWFKMAKLIRETHPSLPVWLIDPNYALISKAQMKEVHIKPVSLFDYTPRDFAKLVEDVLLGK